METHVLKAKRAEQRKEVWARASGCVVADAVRVL